jgi:hypothetical protein
MGRHICSTLVGAAIFCVLAAPAAAGSPPVLYGVADDAGKYADDSGAAFYSRIAAAGFKADRFTVTWNPAAPMTIPEKVFLDRAVPEAAVHGVQIVMSVRPTRANAIGGSLVQARKFATYLALVARTYPSVKIFVVGNEPNQPRFWQPQFRNGQSVAGADYEHMLALAYDALKKVDKTIKVAGGGLSGRGNDNAQAASNSSTSPLRFLYDMGRAYRASKRTTPIMDLLSFHPYPRSSLDSLQKGLEWPMAGYANLNRVKQGLWDAFAGTKQPTTDAGLGILIDEVGWQVRVDSTAQDSLYTGTENVPVATESHQADVYSQLVKATACDSSVKALFFLPFIDETSLTGFQSGLLRADGTERPSYTAVKSAIAATHGTRCLGRRVSWKPMRSVLGAHAIFRGLTVPKSSVRQRAWSFAVRSAEDSRYVATIVPAGAARKTSDIPGPGLALMKASGFAKANWTPLVRFPKLLLRPGRYTYRVELRAAFNPLRKRVFVSRAFVVR